MTTTLKQDVIVAYFPDLITFVSKVLADPLNAAAYAQILFAEFAIDSGGLLKVEGGKVVADMQAAYAAAKAASPPSAS